MGWINTTVSTAQAFGTGSDKDSRIHSECINSMKWKWTAGSFILHLFVNRTIFFSLCHILFPSRCCLSFSLLSFLLALVFTTSLFFFHSCLLLLSLSPPLSLMVSLLYAPLPFSLKFFFSLFLSLPFSPFSLSIFFFFSLSFVQFFFGSLSFTLRFFYSTLSFLLFSLSILAFFFLTSFLSLFLALLSLFFSLSFSLSLSFMLRFFFFFFFSSLEICL